MPGVLAVAYLTVRELKTHYLEQLNATAEHDGALQSKLDAASAIVDLLTGATFATPAPGAELVYGNGTPVLDLPAYVTGTVTDVTAPSGYTVPDNYVEFGGALWVTDANGILLRPYPARLSHEGYVGHVWTLGVPYTVSATFGYGAVPDDIKMVCGEIAVQLWRRRDLGGTEVQGVEGASAIAIRNALSPLAQAVLQKHTANNAMHIGVW
jgi:hypothetical protein